MMQLRVLAAVLLTMAPLGASAQDGQVFKSPSCGCCAKWVAHMRENGFALEAHDRSQAELQAIKAKAGISKPQASCHTALIGGYAIEGHVPASAVARLLSEKPDAAGLAVPGMPANSPGMETDGPGEDFDVLLVKKDGSAQVFEHVKAGQNR